MNPDTVEIASVDTASELAYPFERPWGAPRLPAAGVLPRPADGPSPAFDAGPRSRHRSRRSSGPGARGLFRLRALGAADPAKLLAIRDSWRALWSSRLLVWFAGMAAALAFGAGPVRSAFNPPGVTRGFGWLGSLLAAPAARWDAAWYLVIAHYGYRPDLGAFTASRTAFFPLYPMGLSAIAHLGAPPILAGVLLSCGALALALYGIHRLTTLELGSDRISKIAGSEGGEVARLAVMVTAFAPMAFFFSAVYSESLYLALSVGVFLCARQGRWAWVGMLGALAAATRSAGVVLLLPAVMLYLYGPREDLTPDFGAAARLRPNYRLRRDFLWLALVPAGLGIYMAYLACSGGDAGMPFHAQDVWGRHFAGPYVGVWDGAKAAFAGARQLLAQGRHVYFPAAGGSPNIVAGHNLMLLVFLLAAVPMVVGVLRMLPLAYGVYTIVALALPLSYPVAAQPLMSLPRFLVVLFPLSIWLAAWLAAHPRARMPVILGSGLLMACFVAQFATWHWVA